MTDFMKLARRRGMVPDWVWYQTNGKSAQDNYAKQRENNLEKIQARIDAENEIPQFIFISEVKMK